MLTRARETMSWTRSLRVLSQAEMVSTAGHDRSASRTRTDSSIQAALKLPRARSGVHVRPSLANAGLDGSARVFIVRNCRSAPNTDRARAMTAAARKLGILAGPRSDALINFGEEGNPNHRGLPNGLAYEPVPRRDVFRLKCELKQDPKRMRAKRSPLSSHRYGGTKIAYIA